MNNAATSRAKCVRLGFAGDFCLTAAGYHGYEYVCDIQQFVHSLTAATDWSMANLEFCIIPDYMEQHVPMGVSESYCAHLNQTGFDAFCLANNHIKDGGDEALMGTIRTLSRQDIKTVGAGSNAAAARRAMSLEVSGVSMAVLAATDATHYGASRRSPGVATLHRRRLIGQVRHAASNHQLVVVNIHSDLEFTNYPAPWRVRLSRALVRAGAHLVIHHHPHTLQGLEYYAGGLIAYSLGNLVFPLDRNNYMRNRPGRVDHGAFLYVDVSLEPRLPPRISHTLFPIALLPGDRSRQADEETAELVRQALSRYSRDLLDAPLLRRAHFDRCKSEALKYVKGLYYAGARKDLKAFWRTAMHPLKTRMARQALVGFATGGLF